MNQLEFAELVRDAIAVGHRVFAKGSKLIHEETHGDGRTYALQVSPGSIQHIAFSLDVKGLEPFGVFNKSTAGVTCRNDLTIVCWRDEGAPVVFILELKDSTRPLEAQAQLEAGAAFSKYLFTVLRQLNPQCPEPEIRGIVAYNMPKPPQGFTNVKNFKPKFRKVGTLLRSDWKLTSILPLIAFLSAV